MQCTAALSALSFKRGLENPGYNFDPALWGYSFIPLFLALLYMVERSPLITHPGNPQALIFKSTFSTNGKYVRNRMVVVLRDMA